MPNKIIEPARKSLPKLRAKDILLFILAAGIVAALFVSPLQGREASAAPPAQDIESSKIRPIVVPPEYMCIGDVAPLVLSYSIVTSYTTKDISNIAVSATPTQGTLTPSSWSFFAGMGSGTITTMYEAKTEGEEKIPMVFTYNTGETSDQHIWPFHVINCNRTVSFAASFSSDTALAMVDTVISGKGGVKITDSGGVRGGGTYQYFLGVSYTPDVPTMVCDKFITSTNQSMFDVIGYMGNDKVIKIKIYLYPFDAASLIANCVDGEGHHLKRTLLNGKHVDPNQYLDLESLVFAPGETVKAWKSGQLTGSIWLIERKGSGQ